MCAVPASAARTSTSCMARTPSPATRASSATSSPARSRRSAPTCPASPRETGSSSIPWYRAGPAMPAASVARTSVPISRSSGSIVTAGSGTWCRCRRATSSRSARDLPVEIAALAEPFSIAANVLSRTGCGPEDTVLIYGAGTVGLTVLQVAKLKGARCLISDLDEARLERARSFGADAVINPRTHARGGGRQRRDGRPGPLGGDRRGRGPGPARGGLPRRQPGRPHRPPRLLARALQHQPAGDRQEGAHARRLEAQPAPSAGGRPMAGERQPETGRHDHPDLRRPGTRGPPSTSSRSTRNGP